MLENSAKKLEPAGLDLPQFLHLCRDVPEPAKPLLLLVLRAMDGQGCARELRQSFLRFFQAAGRPDAYRVADHWMRSSIRLVTVSERDRAV